MVSLSRRVAGFAACLALLGFALTLAPAGAESRPRIANPTQAAAAADYLVSQLVDGDHLNSSYTGQPDVGATSDALLAIVASGTHASQALAMSAWLQTQASSYAAQGAGASGKLILAATAVAQQPDTWGGVDLVALTTDSLTADPSAGSSSFSAALAILGLRTAGAEVPSAAVDALVGAQDASGAFGYLVDGAFTPDVDTTAVVIQALQRLTATPATDAAIASALAWLQSQLATDHWATYSPANTAGLAIPALMAAGIDVAAPTAWLLDHQLGDGGFAASEAGTASDAYATAQATLGLAGVGLGTVVLVVEPTPSPTGSPTMTTSPSPTGSGSLTPALTPSASASTTAAPSIPRLPSTGSGPASALFLVGVLIVGMAAARARLHR